MTDPLRDLVDTYEYKHDNLSCLQYFYYRGSFTIRHIALEFSNV
jgi:hypothetical protein